LKTTRVFAVGTVFSLRFKLRDTDEHPMTIEASVLYVNQSAGIGLVFIDLSLEDHEKIVKFIEEYMDKI
jgi:hypothetical protein